MSTNPWIDLPANPPYLLAGDEPVIREFNKKVGDIHKIQFEILLPEPFIGDPSAPVILLSNNPGFSQKSNIRLQSDFIKKMHASLTTPIPFIYLNPEYRESGPGRWWRQKLKCLIKHFGDEVVARSVCNVVYFPYPSHRFKHCEVPSQKYSFHLVRQAVKRRAVIVLMRKGKLKRWQDKVKELIGYDKLVVLRNPQMPSISPGNCVEGDYEKVVSAIKNRKTK